MPTFRHKYNLDLVCEKKPLMDHELELFCFDIDHPTEKGGQGKERHFWNASRLILPDIKQNDWNKIQVNSLCRTDHAIKLGNVIQRFRYWPGCAAAGKTFTAGHYAFLWWMADPNDSAVILTSTSGGMLRKRVWPVISDLYYMAIRSIAKMVGVPENVVQCGHMVDSKLTLQAKKGDALHAISGFSVEEGELHKTIPKLQGIHAKRILLVVDEATDTPPAVFKVIKNIEKGCSDLTVLLIWNPKSRTLDPADRAGQPVNGWQSISLECIEWEAKGDEKDLSLKPGLVSRFRGRNSPNVKRKKTIYDFLYTWEDYLLDQGKEDTIEYWKWSEGFPPPAGVSNTVMDEVMIDKYDGRGIHTFYSKNIPIAGLDPAFGGDNCVLQFGLLGDLDIGIMAVQLTEKVIIRPLATSKHEIDYQIAQQSILECEKRGVKPGFLGSDATGIGRGVYSHLTQDFGPCVRVEFGGEPSDLIASEEDLKPSKDVYDRRVTELWYFCKILLLGGQLKGLHHEAIMEFCFRTYEIKSRKTRLQTKEEFKAAFGKSPDNADAISVLCEVARQNGLSPGRTRQVEQPNSDMTKQMDDVYEDTISENNEFDKMSDLLMI